MAAIHDSFPHALELSERGYNAFALIYRSGGADVACEDLARAIAFLHDNAEELQISMDHYSLWGGSAGARMSVRVSSYGTAAFGEEEYPTPAAVILQYTAISDLTGDEPPHMLASAQMMESHPISQCNPVLKGYRLMGQMRRLKYSMAWNMDLAW